MWILVLLSLKYCRSMPYRDTFPNFALCYYIAELYPIVIHYPQDNPNVSLGIVDGSLYTRIALKDDYHKKRLDMLAYTPVEFNHLETLARTLIIPVRQSQFIEENIFNNARLSDCYCNEYGSFTENQFWYQ